MEQVAEKTPGEISHSIHAPLTPIVAPEGDPMLAMIERVLVNPDLPMERLDKMLDLRERQMNKEAEQEFNRAFAAAMAEMPIVQRTSRNNHLNRNYASLDDLIRAARPALSKHGLSLNWEVSVSDGGIKVTAIVRHSSGHFISTSDEAARDKSGSMNVLQGGGSTQTYLKRYTGFAILGMASGDEQDDDGNKSDAAEPISAEQYQELISAIEAKGADADAFLKFIQAKGCKAETLQELTTVDFPRAMADLNAKKAKS